MPYKMNEPQFKNVCSLPTKDRLSHFIGKVADWEQLWGVGNEDGWLMPITPEDLEYFPVWPHPEYAQRIVAEHFPGNEPKEIDLDTFLNEAVPDLQNTNVKIAIFPNFDWTFWVMEPDDLALCLRQEMALYE